MFIRKFSHTVVASLFCFLCSSLFAAVDPFQEGLALPTTYSSDSVAVGDFNNDGIPDMVVSLQSDTIAVFLGKGNGTFRSPIISNANDEGPFTNAVVADFNGDGNLDLAALGTLGTCIFFGNGDGTLQSPVCYTVSVTFPFLAIGDFNGDGKPDLAVSGTGDNGIVEIFLNKGNGTFGAGVNYNVAGSPNSLIAGDFNGDGKLDLAVACGFDQVISILIGNGDGTFKNAVNYPASGIPVAIDAGDFNNDGKLDLVFTYLTTQSEGVDVLLGNGDGTFGSPISTVGPYEGSSIAVADLNGDGKADLVVTGQSISVGTESAFSTVTVLLGTGTGTFKPANSPSYDAWNAGGVALGDFNGDHKVDLAIADIFQQNNVPNLVTVFLGNGDGTFKAAPDSNTDQTGYFGASTMVLGDFNGDGKLDAAIGMSSNVNFNSPGLVFALGNGDGTFSTSLTAYPLTSLPTALAKGSFTKDKPLDLAVLTGDGSASNLTVFLNNGGANFTQGHTYAVGNVATQVVVADFNGDQKADLAVSVNGGGGGFNVLLGNGDGTFQNPVLWGLAIDPNGLAVGDFNGDKKADLVGINSRAGGISVLLGNGDGTFQPPQTFFPAIGPVFVASGDFNGDGLWDLVTTNYKSLSIYLSNGDGTFKTPINYSFGDGLGPPVIADLNKDGKLDIVVGIGGCPCAPYGLVVLFGNGDGTFQKPVSYNTLPLTSLALGDVNNDGALDILGMASDELTSVMSTAGTHVSLTSSPNPSKPGQPVTFTATVTAGLIGYGTPTGKVEFKSGSDHVFVQLNQGKAKFTYAIPSKGTYKVEAPYLGDQNFLPNVSPVLVQQVQ
jgi:hypothetical protein